jgi:diguanylate cyclase
MLMWRGIETSLAQLEFRVPAEIEDAFNIHRAKRLVAQTRYLYVGLLITVLPAMYSSSDKAPYWATTILPLAIGALMLIGFATLIPVRAEKIGARGAKKFLSEATWGSPLIAILCSTWCVVNWLYAPLGERAYYPLILSMGSLATAYCLSSVRMAAILNMSIGLFPISTLMLLSGERLDMVAAVCLLVAAIFLLQLIFDQHKQWVSLLTLQHEMRQQAHTDPLTGLLNRRALTAQIDERMADEEPKPFLLALLDLDGFKPINDMHGHAAGDVLLCTVGKRLAEAAGEDAAVARLGGDEFAILIPAGSSEKVETLADDLLIALVPPFAIEGQQLRIGASIGIAQWPENGSDMKTLFEKADKALYAVKREQRRRRDFDDLGVRAA